MSAEIFQINFWGVRGSIACPGSATVRYGGNTSCVEMRVSNQRLIFDAGTGIRVLGENLIRESPVHGHIFFSHSHWDHIQGFPFFSAAFHPENKFDIYGAIAPEGITIEQRLSDQMMHPNFPVPLQIMKATLRFHDLEYGQKLNIGNVTVQTAKLNHPGNAMGYRVSYNQHHAAYVTDTEHFHSKLDPRICELVSGVDVLIYDCTYTDEEYYSPNSSKVGWGHSTWQEAVKIAKSVGVKQLVIFHHDPSHDDHFMDQIGIEAKSLFPNTVVAQEGMIIDVVKRYIFKKS